MKVFLMYRDRDVDLEGVPSTAAALTQDLELDTLFEAMAAGDRFLFDMARQAVLTSLDDPGGIRYRQQILADCLEQPTVIRELYALAVEAIDREKRIWGGSLNRFPESSLHRSVNVLELFVELLKRLRRIAEEHAAVVHSEGLTRFFGMVTNELDDAYLRTVEDHLERLRFHDGLVMSVDIGPANRGTHRVLRKRVGKRTWREWIGLSDRPGYVYQIPDRDQAGADALTELKGRGLSQAATALAQSTDHILAFFQMLRAELGFYVGCLNLRDALAYKGEPTCFPEPSPAGAEMLTGRGLYDVCLSLRVRERVVGNDVMADGKALVIITGANRGGKSTLLRGVGVAQLMMQCGMFVSAESFRADIRQGVFTHFKREEDASLRSGKLDEELGRMSSLVDQLTPNSLVILNESFASTNEREGSEIARQIVRALLESGVKVFYVTHLHDLAQGFHGEQRADMLFLRAERESDGHRTFRLIEGEPLPTSYGEDVYRRIFQAGGQAAAAS